MGTDREVLRGLHQKGYEMTRAELADTRDSILAKMKKHMMAEGYMFVKDYTYEQMLTLIRKAMTTEPPPMPESDSPEARGQLYACGKCRSTMRYSELTAVRSRETVLVCKECQDDAVSDEREALEVTETRGEMTPEERAAKLADDIWDCDTHAGKEALIAAAIRDAETRAADSRQSFDVQVLEWCAKDKSNTWKTRYENALGDIRKGPQSVHLNRSPRDE